MRQQFEYDPVEGLCGWMQAARQPSVHPSGAKMKLRNEDREEAEEAERLLWADEHGAACPLPHQEDQLGGKINKMNSCRKVSPRIG